MKNFKLTVAAMLICVCHGTLLADNPVITKVTDREHGASLEALSDNGRWAVGYGKSILSEIHYSFPVLYDVETGVLKKLYTEQEGQTIARMMACDVTNDGETIAGQYDGKPALYHTSTSTWELLPFDNVEWEGGECSQITPDGKYGLGTLEARGRVLATVAYWDFTGETPVAVPLENLPKPISLDGVLNENYRQIYARALSPDGRSFTGLVMFSFAGEDWSFIYNVDSKSWMAFGYDVTEIDDKHYRFTRKTFDGYRISGGQFLHDGSGLFAGSAHNGRESRFYLDPKNFSIRFDDNVGGWHGAMDNTGTFYSSDEIAYTARNWIFRVGEYWYDFREACRQVWGIDWQNDITKDEYGLTGTFMAVSDDGLTVVADDYSNKPYDSFVIRFSEPLREVAPQIDLLDNYTVTPAGNSSFGLMKEVKVKFDRDIDILGNYNSVKLVDENGNVMANSLSFNHFADDKRTVVTTFRNYRLEAGKTYQVVFPQGSLCVSGDAERKNKEIRISYSGRPDEPVKPLQISPEPNTRIERINASSNPIAVTFDTHIIPVENNAGRMMLYMLNENDEREEICQLSGSITDNVLAIFPVMEQRLARGSRYELVVEANTLCDLSGADPNEEIVIPYEGSYTPDASIGAVVFSDNFDGGLSSLNWMIYDGDELTPNTEMTSWGFNQMLPWWLARDNVGDTDMCAVSHSMYTAPGQSDDWLVTRQLYINDPTYTLTFKAQSYRNNCGDVLKVYVYATDDVYTALTKSVIERMRNNGDLVYEEVLSPGANEDLLAGDWVDYLISLDKYEGKNIYIAFVNDNNNKSAVFVDDVIVSRDVKMSFVNLTPESGVSVDNVKVSGIIKIESKTDTYKGYSIKVVDNEGKTVSSIANPDEEMAEGWELEFTMPDALPTPVGKVTDYTIDITFGDKNEKTQASFMNLAVATTKKVVIEEYTGQTCPNCPIGHAALEWIEQDFPGQVIPITIHSYPGDTFSTPKAVALQQGLGLEAAPTARVDRMPVASPMSTTQNEEYFYKNNGLWYDYVVEQLSSLAPADIEITRVDFDGTDYMVDMEVRYALDMDNQNVNILTLICENGLQGVQENNRYTFESPALRGWGRGGEYGQPNVPYVYNDVVRTWEGTTFNGTGGYIPSVVESSKVYAATVKVPNVRWILNNDNTTVTAMLIDSTTGHILNADRKAIHYDSGVQMVSGNAFGPEIKNIGGKVIVTGESEIAVDAFAVDGRHIASAKGNESVCIDLSGTHGVTLIVARTAHGVRTLKLCL
ncbi:MAG: choice-of-anchor J domain-containing protein [Candidatus Amulumruptor caecigallinarius]|nr:choice-of-anchor J domain-containing protein [Candidatus Amulumruptor caecigallinarius]